MIRYLLDTNVLSEATAKNPSPEVIQWLEVNVKECGLSALSIAEIWKVIHLMPKGKRKNLLIFWADHIESEFADATIPFDKRIARIWGEFFARHESAGRNLVLIDSLLAATAIAYELTVVTRNSKDFPPEIPTINPWIK